MADLSVEFAGVRSPNPFWLASAPPTNSEDQVRRAFEAGWGGAVWKTLCREPIVNVSSRYGASRPSIGRKVVGLNNIELISDRPLAVNLAEIDPDQTGPPQARPVGLADGGVETRLVARPGETNPGGREPTVWS